MAVGQRVRPTTLPQSVNRLLKQCGSLDVSETYRPSWPITGIYFTFLLPLLEAVLHFPANTFSLKTVQVDLH
jgi:hypothetical protein